MSIIQNTISVAFTAVALHVRKTISSNEWFNSRDTFGRWWSTSYHIRHRPCVWQHVYKIERNLVEHYRNER